MVERSIYEDMQADYLREREENEHRIKAIDDELEEIKKAMLKQEDKDEILRKYTHIDCLTVPIVQEFIDSIIVDEPNEETGEREITINMAI